jgi:Epoxide hydrolase N terminus
VPHQRPSPPWRTHIAVTVDRSADNTAIRPLTIEFPEAELEELRARIAATRWPEKEGVADASQGVPLATMKAVAQYNNN